MAKLVLDRVSKQYDGKNFVVENFNLEVDQKEFVIFVGPSGCGKSTVLRMIAGLEEITTGGIYIDERPVSGKMAARGDIAMVFQNYALYPHMSVYDNIAYSLKIKGVPKKEIRERVARVAHILELETVLKKKPSQLSGGQKQRVAMGRAMIRTPKLFLMDEPLSNLDAKLRTQMRKEISKLYRDSSSTFIYVTHDQTEAMTLGDRIVIMKDGIVQQVGTPQEVFDHPANIFVAGFIGMPQMNMFDAKLVEQSGKYSVELGGVSIILSEEKQAALAKNNVKSQEITLGIRPEHIALAQPGKDAITGKVDVSEMMGSAIHLHVNACGRDTIIIVQTMDLTGGEDLSIGSEISFAFGGNAVHVFNKETGENLEF